MPVRCCNSRSRSRSRSRFRFRSRCLTAATCLAALIVGGGAAAIAAETTPCWRPPVDGVVVDAFREPACRWCPGNRGIEYRTRPGTPVRAVATGRVTFSGTVAGTRYVVVASAGERLVTYGRLASATVRRGDVVAARTVVGTASTALFFGLRVRGAYTDPAPLLGAWHARPRLVPLHGLDRRPTPMRWRCGRPGRR